MQNFSETTNFLWSVADLIRDTFKRGKYQDVIPPFTVLRRIDCVLAPNAPLEEIGADIKVLEVEILRMLREVTQ